jgi:hypothetical protein
VFSASGCNRRKRPRFFGGSRPSQVQHEWLVGEVGIEPTVSSRLSVSLYVIDIMKYSW